MALNVDGFDIYTKFHAKNYDGVNGVKKKLDNLEKMVEKLDGKTINIKFNIDSSSLSAIKKTLKNAFKDFNIDIGGSFSGSARGTSRRARTVKETGLTTVGADRYSDEFTEDDRRFWKAWGRRHAMTTDPRRGWTSRGQDFPFSDFYGYYLGYTPSEQASTKSESKKRKFNFEDAHYWDVVNEEDIEIIYEKAEEKIKRRIAGLLGRDTKYAEAEYATIVGDQDDEWEQSKQNGYKRRIAGLLERYSDADSFYTDFADINFFNDQMFKAWRYANTKGGTAIVPSGSLNDESSFYFNDETVNKYSDIWRRKFGYKEKEEEKEPFSLAFLRKPLFWTALGIKGMEKLVKFVSTMSKNGLQIAQGAEALNTSASTVMGLTVAGKTMGIENMQGSLNTLQSTITGGKWGNFNSDMYRYLALLGLSYEDTVALGATGTFNKVIENARKSVESGALTQTDARYFVEQILGSSGTQMFDTFSKLGVSSFEEYKSKIGGIASISDDATTNLSEFSTVFSAFNSNLKTSLQEGLGNSTFMGGITKSLSIVNKGLEIFSDTLEKEGILRALGNMGKAMNEKKKEDMEKLLTENEGLYISLFGNDIFLKGGFWEKLGNIQRDLFGIATGEPNVTQTVDNRSPIVNVYVESGGVSGTDPYAFGYGLGGGLMDRLAFGESGGFF